MSWLMVAGGGAVGALMRYGMVAGMQVMFGRNFPIGTLAVNVLGSLLIGILYVILVERGNLPDEWRLALIVGVLGSFTTFSSFSLDTLQLLEQSGAASALLNVLLNVVLCLTACYVGLLAAKQFS